MTSVAVCIVLPTAGDAAALVNALITAAETERRRNADHTLARRYEALADEIGDGVDSLPGPAADRAGATA